MKQLPDIQYKLNPKTRFLSVLDREFFERNLKPADILRKPYTPEIAKAVLIAKTESMASLDDVGEWIGLSKHTLTDRIKVALHGHR